jgi:hypothetical protein
MILKWLHAIRFSALMRLEDSLATMIVVVIDADDMEFNGAGTMSHKP